MFFNISLSISIHVSTTIGSQLLSASDPEQSSSLGQTPVRWVWAEEVAWYPTSMQIMGSQTGAIMCYMASDLASRLR
jgi:hypothetical protein